MRLRYVILTVAVLGLMMTLYKPTMKQQDPKTASETAQYWQKPLSEEQVRVCRDKGTERPFSGKYYNFHEKGVYTCAVCNLELFSSETKFDSGTGWPSFYAPVAPQNIATKEDRSHGMVRTEILCPRCGAHLGHVFDDGPQPTGKRYCVNSVSLQHKPD